MSNQSRSPSEHSEAERAPMLNEVAALLLKRYDDCREKTGLESAVEFELLRLALDESNVARATPAKAGERTLPSIESDKFTQLVNVYFDLCSAQNFDVTIAHTAWINLCDHINAYSQQCARYAVEEYKRAHHTDKGD